MLIDKIKIKVYGGKGGDGVALFSKEKMTLGPTGGDGGQGANVVVEGISDIGALRQFRYKKEFKAEDGRNGGGKCKTGAAGKDIVLKIPVGTVIRNLETLEEKEIVNIGEKVILASGGKGGKGNFFFRSSTRTTPMRFTLGEIGEWAEIELELKLIADIGLVGLPNSGKSSLLNRLTNAKSKVANYQFTTLEPHLGAYEKLIIADIPGLIAGASSGRGLGIKFLRHIERTKIIFHLISCESENIRNDYETIRSEITLYGKGLETKPEYLIITKSDLIAEIEIEKMIIELKKDFPSVLVISIYDDKSIEKLRNLLAEIKFQYQNSLKN